MGPSTETDCGG